MKIYVVKTCDGDMYYPTSRNAFKFKAIEMAVQQILHNDLSSWDEESREEVQAAWDNKDYKKLFSILTNMRAIIEATTSE